MKIGVTYENGQIFQHFGHTEQFRVYEVQDGKVVSSTVVDTNGSGHGALAGFLKEQQVDTLICGGIGAGAQNALAAAGIRLYGGVSGDADAAVEALLKGGPPEDAAEEAFVKQAGMNDRLLKQLADLDRVLNKKLTRDKSIYEH